MFRNALFVLLPMCCLAPARASDLADADHIYNKAAASTALLARERGHGIAPAGTCWVVDAKRKWVVTNWHVTENVDDAYVTFPLYEGGVVVTDARRYDVKKGIKARVIDSDPRADLAILELEKLPDGIKALPLSAGPARRGQTLHLVGQSSISVSYWTYTRGDVRNRNRRSITYSAFQTLDTMLLENQMATNPGDSGSAVLNNKGEVVAVHSGGMNSIKANNLAFAIDLAVLVELLKEAEALSDGRATAELLASRAGRFERKRLWARAVLDYTAALKMKPESAELYHLRGWARRNGGQPAEAVSDLTRALELAPGLWQAANRRGIVHYEQKRYALAALDFTRAIAGSPKDPGLVTNRADALLMLGKHREAIRDCTEAIRLFPNYALAHTLRARAYRALKQHALAAADFEKAVAVFPNDAGLLVELGEELLAARGAAKAEAVFARAIKAAPTSAAALLGHGKALEEQGDGPLASLDYEAAVKLDPSLAKKLKAFSTRKLVLHNNTAARFSFRVAYEEQAPDGTWRRGSAVWTLAPGEKASLGTDGKFLCVRGARVWFVQAGGRFTGAGQELAVAPKPYLGLKRQPFTFTLNPRPEGGTPPSPARRPKGPATKATTSPG